MRRLSLAIAGLLVCLVASTVRAEDKPSGVTIGEMRVQTLPAVTYLHTSAETKCEKLGEVAVAAFDRVFGAAVEAKMIIARPTMMVYQGSPHLDPTKTFKVEMGVIVTDETKLPDNAGDDLKVRKTEPFKCATILYTGPVGQQGQAYQKLIPALKAAGHTPTGEEREMCLYWEGVESSNNVFMMMIGIK